MERRQVVVVLSRGTSSLRVSVGSELCPSTMLNTIGPRVAPCTHYMPCPVQSRQWSGTPIMLVVLEDSISLTGHALICMYEVNIHPLVPFSRYVFDWSILQPHPLLSNSFVIVYRRRGTVSLPVSLVSEITTAAA